MSISVRSAAVAAVGCTAALLALTGCSSSTRHTAASTIPTVVSSTSAVSSSSTTSVAPVTHSAAPATTAAVKAAPGTTAPAKKSTAPAASFSCGSQMSVGGHEYVLWNPMSGKTETNPKCLGLDMHNSLTGLDYDLHGVNPAEAVLVNQASAASTVRTHVTVTFGDYGKVGTVSSLRTVTVSEGGPKQVWHLRSDSAGNLYWTAA